MPIDPYSPCPGGLGKKVKFCCADLVSELDKIDRLREADQRAACLDYIEKLDAKHPGRACLMTAKADLLRDLGRTQEADVAVQTLLDHSATNPVALAEAALLACEEQDALRALSLLMQGLRARQDPMPDKLVQAIRDTAIALLAANEVISGRELLQVFSQLLPQDRSVQNVLAELHQAREVPLLLKQHYAPGTPPDDAPWNEDYNAALEPLKFISWTEAAENLASVTAKHPQAAMLWKALATIRGWLADHRGAAEAWRKYAALDIPLDDAVEAEATAQLLDPESPDFVDMVRVEQPVHDLERMQEVFADHPRIAVLDASQVPPMEGVPPPKAMYLILDRDKQPDGAELDLDQTPRVVGRLLVFGRETDREARLELSAYRGAHLDLCQSLLGELTFGMLGRAQEPEVIERVAASVVQLELRWFMQKPPLPDRLQEVRNRHRERYLSEQWPSSPQTLLDGKTPQQAAASPASRNRVLAALLRLETQIDQAGVEFDFDGLRRRLNLPVPEPVRLGDGGLGDVPLVRMSRIELKDIDDTQVSLVAMRSIFEGLVKSTRRAMQELLERTPQKRTIPEGVCLEHLAMSIEDPTRKLELLEKASQALDRDKISSAAVDVARLQLHMYRQDQQQALELIVHLIDEHLNDQQHGQLVIETLASLGLVRPDGRILRPRVDRTTPASDAGTEAGKIWTPDSDRPANKPALWVPGS